MKKKQCNSVILHKQPK